MAAGGHVPERVARHPMTSSDVDPSASRARPARRRDGTLQCAPFGSPFVGSRMRPISLPAALCYSLAVVALVSGCSSTSYTCSGNGEYQKAQDKPRLAMPAGVSGGEKVAGTL